MKPLFQKLAEQLARTGPGARVAAAGGLIAIAAILVYASWNANRPSFKLLYSNLDAAQAAAIQNALASGNVRYQVNQPPGPYVIHVEESKYYDAQNAVALSGALDSSPGGIQTGGGTAGQVFMSAVERQQSALKREWQEMERQLEVLDFVQRASVSTSVPVRTLGRKSEPQTVAVMLQLRGGTELSRAQSQTVAQLVRFRFDVPASNVMISDQHGNSLFSGSDGSERGPEGDDLFEHKQRYDEDLARRTNGVLDKMFGAGKAYVLVNTDWSWQDTETVTERYDPKGVVVSESKLRTETPQVGAPTVGGPAGTASNLASDPGAPGAQPVAAAATGDAPVATTSEESKQSLVGRETQLSRSRTPKLERMAVSLFIDETVGAEADTLQGSVQASVGFDKDRGDVFSAMITPFASLRDAEGNILEPEAPAPVEEPNALLEILLGRGVEILAALAFLFVLFRTLKGGAPKAPTAEQVAAREREDNDLLERLAKGQIEELVRSDPARVSSILSRWAAEEVPSR